MQIDAPLEVVFRLNDAQKKALRKLGIQTALDLLYHFPSRYGDMAEVKSIGNLSKGESAVIFGTVTNLQMKKAFRKKIPMATGKLSDGTGTIELVWFNQPYLAKMIEENAKVRVEGKVSARRAKSRSVYGFAGSTTGISEQKEKLYISNPKIEKAGAIPAEGSSLFGREKEVHALHPVYPESRGISSNWFVHAIQKTIQSGILETLTDPIPNEILKKYHLPSLTTALIWIHAPKTEDNATAARKRFAFEEVFFIQLEKQKERSQWQKETSFVIERGDEHITNFVRRFPFSFTAAQNRAIRNILDDFRTGVPMARLLEGDVGSGKTAVAAATAYAVTTTRPLKSCNSQTVAPQHPDYCKREDFGNLQVAYMCPTEILARQQFANFISFFSHLPINIGLITSSGCQKFPSKVNPHDATDISRSQLLKWVANGEVPILVGTHSLIQKSVRFKHLAYVIIDEQHRFGVTQRRALVHKEKIVPHLLSMTATPIPRTLALTIYGDLDLTVLDELPPGRKPIVTEIVRPDERDATYEKIREELKKGRQCYIITPRIDEPDPAKEFAIQAKSVKAEAKRLKEKVFQEFEIGVMHGKLKDNEKEAVMEEFKDGTLNILVSTSVVEVGMNVPNATVILIEGAERFGLSQLHQLRGRVQRSSHQPYCYVFTESGGKTVLERLKALGHAKNGFELAEYDLKFRGAGTLSGREQWGVSDIAMEALQNLKMVEAARAEAGRLLEEDETLSRYPLLAAHLKHKEGHEIHME